MLTNITQFTTTMGLIPVIVTRRTNAVMQWVSFYFRFSGLRWSADLFGQRSVPIWAQWFQLRVSGRIRWWWYNMQWWEMYWCISTSAGILYSLQCYQYLYIGTLYTATSTGISVLSTVLPVLVCRYSPHCYQCWYMGSLYAAASTDIY